MKKLLQLLGFKYCILCGRLKFRGRRLSWYDEDRTLIKAFTCEKCIREYRED